MPTKPAPSEQFPCHLCKFKTSNQSALADHLRKHSVQLSFTCETCHFSCNQQAGLTFHQLRDCLHPVSQNKVPLTTTDNGIKPPAPTPALQEEVMAVRSQTIPAQPSPPPFNLPNQNPFLQVLFATVNGAKVQQAAQAILPPTLPGIATSPLSSPTKPESTPQLIASSPLGAIVSQADSSAKQKTQKPTQAQRPAKGSAKKGERKRPATKSSENELLPSVTDFSDLKKRPRGEETVPVVTSSTAPPTKKPAPDPSDHKLFTSQGGLSSHVADAQALATAVGTFPVLPGIIIPNTPGISLGANNNLLPGLGLGGVGGMIHGVGMPMGVSGTPALVSTPWPAHVQIADGNNAVTNKDRPTLAPIPVGAMFGPGFSPRGNIINTINSGLQNGMNVNVNVQGIHNSLNSLNLTVFPPAEEKQWSPFRGEIKEGGLDNSWFVYPADNCRCVQVFARRLYPSQPNALGLEIYVAIDEAMLVNGAKSSFVIDEDSKIFDLATLAFPASVLAFAEKLSFRTHGRISVAVLPSSVASMSRLKALHAPKTGLGLRQDRMPLPFALPPLLVELDLSENSLKALPREWFSLNPPGLGFRTHQHLSVVNLSFNPLLEFPQLLNCICNSWTLLTRLSCAQVANSAGSRWPPNQQVWQCLERLSQLTQLNLLNREVSFLPDLSNLPLQELACGGSSLQALPNLPPSLLNLDLGHAHRLVSIDKNLKPGSLPRLRSVVLQSTSNLRPEELRRLLEVLPAGCKGRDELARLASPDPSSLSNHQLNANNFTSDLFFSGSTSSSLSNHPPFPANALLSGSSTPMNSNIATSGSSEGLCVQCSNGRKTYACIPCSHLCLCIRCAQLVNSNKAPMFCPVCNKKVDSAIMITV